MLLAHKVTPGYAKQRLLRTLSLRKQLQKVLHRRNRPILCVVRAVVHRQNNPGTKKRGYFPSLQGINGVEITHRHKQRIHRGKGRNLLRGWQVPEIAKVRHTKTLGLQ